ncbi:unnamed protein product [Prunus armeniaca]|uniref:Uncharacterized protein n=1 Tax=Prunus armeniaca TaxID=36596 RepID=A0A6J5XHT6_PRUAR|nr:unnamed protein product [Prunus armeniaca]
MWEAWAQPDFDTGTGTLSKNRERQLFKLRSYRCPSEYLTQRNSKVNPIPYALHQLTVSVDFYVCESLIIAGAANATVLTSSLVLTQIITTLAAYAGVSALSTDDIGSSDTIKVNNQVTLHRIDAHYTFGGFFIEKQAFLDSLSASHQVTHALLRRIWDRLDTYSELLLSLAGHIQPTNPPRPPRARSI